MMRPQEPIDFDDYKLSCQKNILTCKPKPTRKGSPAVTVNLNEVVGVERNEEGSMLKLGLKMFSKECRDIRYVPYAICRCMCCAVRADPQTRVLSIIAMSLVQSGWPRHTHALSPPDSLPPPPHHHHVRPPAPHHPLTVSCR